MAKMPKRFLIVLAWSIIFMVAAYLRFHNLGERPVHFDEATGAHIAAGHLETGDYFYDPTHFHGPVLSFSTKLVSLFTGQDTWEELDIVALRWIPAIAGILMVMAPLLWVRLVGPAPALATAGILATSPLLVYYSRMYIHEILLGSFGLLTLLLAKLAFMHRDRIAYWLLAGTFLGLMIATKETFVFSIFAWSVAFVAAFSILRHQLSFSRLDLRQWVLPVCSAIAAALLITTLLYTNMFRHPEALIDLIRSYFVYQKEPGHEKPFFYYFSLIALPQGVFRMFWWEGMVMVLAGIPVVAAFSGKRSHLEPEQKFSVLFLLFAALLHFLIYSLIGYKTPWLIVLPWVHVCLLAGLALLGFSRHTRQWRVLITILVVAILVLHGRQSTAVSGRFANDPRNPYAYVPTSSDLLRLEEWLVALDQQSQPQGIEPIVVVGKYYWPLPWYLRSFEKVGYWGELDPSFANMPVVFIMPEHFAGAEILLGDTHVALPRGLRQENPMILYLRKDIWKAWIGEDTP